MLIPLLFSIDGGAARRMVGDLDAIEARWRSKGLHPMTPAGEFPINAAHSVTREADVLTVITTEGSVLMFRIERRR